METLDITEADIAEDPTGAADKLDKLARHAEDLVIEADEGFAAMMARLPRLRCMVLAAAIQAQLHCYEARSPFRDTTVPR